LSESGEHLDEFSWFSKPGYYPIQVLAFENSVSLTHHIE
jgi:hypothetical protein